MRRWNKRHRLLLRWMLVSGVILLGATLSPWLGRQTNNAAVVPGSHVDGVTSVLKRDSPSQPSPIRFEDVTADSGIVFRHFPAERASLLPEDMGSGVAVADYDNDGYPDLFFVNFSGSVLPGTKPNLREGRSRLYRNMGGAYFEDATDRAGVGLVGHGMGAAWGDYDNDGDVDLYVTAYGGNVLFENDGEGSFHDVTRQTGTQDTRFSAGCAWADYDRDGDLDLYVCNYVDFVFRPRDRGTLERQYATEQPYTLNPSSYPPLPNCLFRNNGDGTFEEVAGAVGVADPSGRSLSASWVDMNNDGWVDLYVANDVSNNGVFLNNGDGTFSDVGAASLAADYRGAMGIAVADFDNDLDLDVFITHWIAQENALYRNMILDAALGGETAGRVWFMDEADGYGLGQVSLDMIGWATGFCDFDNDGLPDLWLVNGSTFERAEDHRFLRPQQPFIFWNQGSAGFVDIVPRATGRLARPFVGRGGAQVDLDLDGLVDLIFVVHAGSPIILKNTSRHCGHWLRVRLRQTGGNTHALGARVYVTASGKTQMGEVGCSSSYLSQHELTLHFGLGDAKEIDLLRIVWPDGESDLRENLTTSRQLEFVHASRYSAGKPTSP